MRSSNMLHRLAFLVAAALALGSCGACADHERTTAAPVEPTAAPAREAAAVPGDGELASVPFLPTPPVASDGPRTCPAATDVRYVSWRAPYEEEDSHDLPRTGWWSIPVGFRGVDEPSAPPPGPIAASALSAIGLEPVPQTVWLLRPGAPACEAHVTGYFGLLVEDGVSNIRVSAVTTDCAPAGGAERETWAAFTPPGDCELHLAAEVGSVRLVGAWSESRVPTERAPIPPRYAAAVPPPEACPEPCDARLWYVNVAPGAPDVAEVWVTSIASHPEGEPCNWSYDSHAGLYVPDASGAMRLVPWPDDGSGYGPPMTLDGTLVDASGTRVVLFTDHARSATFELEEDGTIGAGHRIEHYMMNEEDGIFRSLGPNCGP